MPYTLRTLPASPSLRLLALAGVVALSGCDTTRDRPTAPDGPRAGDGTLVWVVRPSDRSLVASDSGQVVVVQAEGDVRAVEFLLIQPSARDTLRRARREFPAALSSVEVVFGVRIPGLATGVLLEFRGVAEDGSGGRFLSEPVVVEVVECDRFPQACGGG